MRYIILFILGIGIFFTSCASNTAAPQEDRKIRSIINDNKLEAQRAKEEFRNLKRQRGR